MSEQQLEDNGPQQGKPSGPELGEEKEGTGSHDRNTSEVSLPKENTNINESASGEEQNGDIEDSQTLMPECSDVGSTPGRDSAGRYLTGHKGVGGRPKKPGPPPPGEYERIFSMLYDDRSEKDDKIDLSILRAVGKAGQASWLLKFVLEHDNG